MGIGISQVVLARMLEDIRQDALEGSQWGGVRDNWLLRLTGKALLARAAGPHCVHAIRHYARPEHALTCMLDHPSENVSFLYLESFLKKIC